MGYGRSPAREGAGLGALAGILMAVAGVLAAVAAGQSPLYPLRLSASVLVGYAAFAELAPATAGLIGIVVHLVLAAGFGSVYAGLLARAAPETRESHGAQVAFGFLFGSGLWLFDQLLLASVLYPWLLDVPAQLGWLMHAVCYGLPLGLMAASLERQHARLRARNRLAWT